MEAWGGIEPTLRGFADRVPHPENQAIFKSVLAVYAEQAKNM